MRINVLTISLATLMMTGCANHGAMPSTHALATQDNVVGIWAMVPLRNGIANVVEYSADAKATLHPFNCAEPGKHQEKEVSDFKVSDDGKVIHLKSPSDNFDLKVLAFDPQTMTLSMDVSDTSLTFNYVKVSNVAPLCALYPNAAAEAARKTPFKASDFVADPGIPAHSGMERYIGKWANDKGELEVEVIMGPNGSAYLYMASSKNWHFLYNEVHWVGDELHFESYAYSDLPSLYSHPFHKSKTHSILQPSGDGGLRYSIFIDKRRYEFPLSRAKN
ncbi:hypothetical protein HX869_14070 [Pseudomonas sp. P7779]|uniref:hypothetical protein n=1 Tax=Pseudomonas sp. P7779 TaxID=2738832 RepID=UPI0015C0C01F|nr:hypothetical protein [Pseudomonas sp. P7779]NWC99869.1 hypothetical protein [Pseudomonas sp. P7779]